MPFVVIEYWTECHEFIMFNHILNYESTQLSSSLDLDWLIPVLWHDLISFTLFTWLNWVLFFESIYLAWFNYFDSDVIPLTFRVGDCERNFQSHSRSYDRLGPDLTQNTWGRYILILPVVLATPTPASPAPEVLPTLDLRLHYLPLAWSLS